MTTTRRSVENLSWNVRAVLEKIRDRHGCNLGYILTSLSSSPSPSSLLDAGILVFFLVIILRSPSFQMYKIQVLNYPLWRLSIRSRQ